MVSGLGVIEQSKAKVTPGETLAVIGIIEESRKERSFV